MQGVVESIYVTGEGSAAMERVDEVRTIEGCGIEGDRYCEGTGYWTNFGDVCEITLISSEDLEHIERELSISVGNGEHRRNIVTRGSASRTCVESGSGSGRRSSSTTGPVLLAGTSRT